MMLIGDAIWTASATPKIPVFTGMTTGGADALGLKKAVAKNGGVLHDAHLDRQKGGANERQPSGCESAVET